MNTGLAVQAIAQSAWKMLQRLQSTNVVTIQRFGKCFWEVKVTQHDPRHPLVIRAIWDWLKHGKSTAWAANRLICLLTFLIQDAMQRQRMHAVSAISQCHRGGAVVKVSKSAQNHSAACADGMHNPSRAS